jgi:hypothetical protein
MLQKHMDMEILSSALPAILATGPTTQPWARKESLKLLAVLTSKQGSPNADAIFNHSAHLSRICQCDLSPGPFVCGA